MCLWCQIDVEMYLKEENVIEMKHKHKVDQKKRKKKRLKDK